MPAIITLKRNGSIRIEGDFVLLDYEGNPFDLNGRTHVSLCRCGLSQDKPFCDHTHKTIGYVEESKARVMTPPPPPKPAQ